MTTYNTIIDILDARLMLDHVHHRLPVTALAFYNGEDVILAGEGRYLQAYDVKTRETLASVPVFLSQAVHGIVISNDNPHLAVVWGGDLVRTVRVESPSKLDLGPVCRAPDWILDGAFTHNVGGATSQEYIAFVTAHNALLLTTIAVLGPRSDSDQTVLVPTVLGSNCILYSAHVTWLSASQCLIASGTAFGDIIVWSAKLLNDANGHLQATAQVHYTFSAHDGSVFGVRISSPVESLGGKRVLASCSDDRTVRVWDISDLSIQSPTLTDVQRDTGFGSKPEHETHAPPCLAKAMGHVSRIWHVRLLQDENAKANEDESPMLRIMSFGEDASNITWSLESPPECKPLDGAMVLRRIACQTAHAGKHIWSVAMSLSGQIATGGSDGAVTIRSHPLDSTSPMQLIPSAIGHEKDRILSFDFVAMDTLVAVTEDGRVLRFHILDRGEPTVDTLSDPMPELHHYSATSGVPGAVFMAGTLSAVFVYDHQSSKITQFAQTDGKKIAGLFTSVDQDSSNISLLVCTMGRNKAQLMPGISLENVGISSNVAEHATLDLPYGFLVTSFAQCEDAGHSIIALGSRRGMVALYRLEPGGVSGEALALFEAHGKESVAALRWSGTTYIHSIGRDGAHALHHAMWTDGSCRVDTVHNLKLPFGPNIDGMSISHDQLWFGGFRYADFVVYDARSHKDIMTVECGGGRRCFAFQPKGGGGTFVWTTGSKVYWQLQHELPYELLNSGWHGREVKSMAISPTDLQIIATGSEDTDIKLSKFDEGKRELRCLQTLRRHNTGIQHLQWSSDGRYLLSSGGFEEFFVWRITFDLPDINLGVICESVHPRTGHSDLRIMGFSAVELSSERSNASFAVTMAYSDSSVKLWKYNNRDWSWMGSGGCLTACLTEAVHLDDPGLGLLTTATDGYLTRWNNYAGKASLTWTDRHKIHQNAVLSAANVQLSDDCHVLITGGDDNAISITRLHSDKTGVQTLRIPRAHAAAVTGLSVILHGLDKIVLASASIDQRVKVWEIAMGAGAHNGEIDVKKLWSVHTSVADVSSLEKYCFSDGGVGLVVSGVGIEILKLRETAA